MKAAPGDPVRLVDSEMEEGIILAASFFLFLTARVLNIDGMLIYARDFLRRCRRRREA